MNGHVHNLTNSSLDLNPLLFRILHFGNWKSAPAEVQNVLSPLSDKIDFVSFNEEADKLALAYMKEGVVTPKYLLDAQHIALASVLRVDVMVSWNFKHIVNLNRIRLYNAANLKNGYPLIDIRTPREVLNEKES